MQVATIYSAVKLEQEQQFLVAKKLQELTGSKNIKLKTVIDESLIAGLRVDFGSAQIDLSIKGQLEDVASDLVAGSGSLDLSGKKSSPVRLLISLLLFHGQYLSLFIESIPWSSEYFCFSKFPLSQGSSVNQGALHAICHPLPQQASPSQWSLPLRMALDQIILYLILKASIFTQPIVSTLLIVVCAFSASAEGPPWICDEELETCMAAEFITVILDSSYVKLISSPVKQIQMSKFVVNFGCHVCNELRTCNVILPP